MSVDPHQDPRPPARVLFNPEYVRMGADLRNAVRVSSRKVGAEDVTDAWQAAEWHDIPDLSLTGLEMRVADHVAFPSVLPYIGTNRVAYSMKDNWVCRQYALAFASVVSAFLAVNVGIVCDESGHHMYNWIPLHTDGKVKAYIVEPQLDEIVVHLNPQHHYVGKTGFALVV